MSTLAEVEDLARRIARDVAAVHAEDVDRHARFPKETVDAFRTEGLLGALVPTELGGLGHDLRQAAAVVRIVARSCASSAMVLAMHHIQVATLVRHGGSAPLQDFTRRIAAEQLLLASATTEIGIGGNTRNSSLPRRAHRRGCRRAVPPGQAGPGDLLRPARRRHRRHRPSHGGQRGGRPGPGGLRAQRRPPDPALGLGHPRLPRHLLHGLHPRGHRPARDGQRHPFGDISTQTMLPTSHLLWSSLWLGLAQEARHRSQRFVQKAARRDLATMPPGAPRLAALMVTEQQLASSVDALMLRYEQCAADADACAAIDFMVAINALKVSASTLVVDIVGQAMLICGIQGYREDSEFTLGRLLRDAHGAAVMVNNDRIATNTAQLALVQREA